MKNVLVTLHIARKYSVYVYIRGSFESSALLLTVWLLSFQYFHCQSHCLHGSMCNKIYA